MLISLIQTKESWWLALSFSHFVHHRRNLKNAVQPTQRPMATSRTTTKFAWHCHRKMNPNGLSLFGLRISTMRWIHQKNAVSFIGSNTGFAKYNVEFDVECNKSEETVVTGAYNDQNKAFKFLIQSPSVCWQNVPASQMVLHNYRLLYFLSFLALGLYCTLFGMRDIKFTLQLIGFTIGFTLTFTLLSISFYSGMIKSIARLSCCWFVCLGRSDRLFLSKSDRKLDSLSKLHFQCHKQSLLCLLQTCFLFPWLKTGQP